jgi:precorrin-2/cobalt-factor-2 C20-methyltransferase
MMFYGIGLGPGDPELITRKAARILAEVGCVFFPAGSASSGHARRILLALGVPEAKLRPVSLCMNRSRGDDQNTYLDTAQDIVALLRKGQSVAWAAQGDPLLYSTFLHVYEQVRNLEPEAATQIVPGVTSLQAAAACAGWPIARLDEKVAVVPAVYGLDSLPRLLEDFATVFLVKVNSVLDELVRILDSLAPGVQAVYLENLGTSEERLVTELDSLRGRPQPYFSLVMIRKKKPTGSGA